MQEKKEESKGLVKEALGEERYYSQSVLTQEKAAGTNSMNLKFLLNYIDLAQGTPSCDYQSRGPI